MEFSPFQKLPRLSRGCVITEKIDGTNASIHIEVGYSEDPEVIARIPTNEVHYTIRAGSRTRWITPEDDNFGFAKWVQAHAEELLSLGVGHHFGEWWGKGIQRGYGRQERYFSLFNTGRWINSEEERTHDSQQLAPECCLVVPVVWAGPFNDETVNTAMTLLTEKGSHTAPGFMDPEGIVIYHIASGHQYKKTIKKDESPKGK